MNFSRFLPVDRYRNSNLGKILVLLAMCILDILLGIKASSNILLIILATITGIGGIILLTKRLEWGLLFVIPASFFGRWNVSTGTNVAFNITIILLLGILGVWILRMMIFEHKISLASSPVNIPAILFISIQILSMINGNIHWFPQISEKASTFAQIGSLLLYALSIITLLLPVNLIRDVNLLAVIYWQFLILGFIFVASHLIPFTARYINRIFVSGDYLGSTFWIWIVAFSTSSLLLTKRKSKKQIYFLLALLAMVFYDRWVLYREWVSGWLPPLIAAMVIFWMYNWRLAFICSLIGFAIIGTQYTNLANTIMTDTQQYSAYSRSATWPILFDIIKVNPILGLGPANYYYYTPLFSLLGWHVQFNSHNNYLDILAQYGLLGFGSFTWLMIEITQMISRLKRQNQDNFCLVYGYACAGGFVGMLVAGLLGDWFLPFLYNISTGGFRFSVLNWLFLGGLVLIDTTTQKAS